MRATTKTAKKFGQLKAGDYLHFVNPSTSEVESQPIKKIKMNITSQFHIDITYYTLSSMEEKEEDETINMEDLLTMTLAAPMGADFCMSMGGVPTAYCTDKGKLEEWVKKG